MSPQTEEGSQKATLDDGMTIAQRAHALGIANRFHSMILAKYAAGAKEHGGNIWERYSELELIDSAIDEAIDQATYLLTLRDKIKARLSATQ